MPHLPVASSSTVRSAVVDLVARGKRLLERHATDHVAERGDRQLLDRLDVVGDLVGRGLGVGHLVVDDRVDVHRQVVLGDHGLRRERHDLLAQVDERPEPVDERHQDRQSRVERAAEPAEPLDDAGARLRDDSHRPRQHEQHHEGDDEKGDESSHGSCLLFLDERRGALDLDDFDPRALLRRRRPRRRGARSTPPRRSSPDRDPRRRGRAPARASRSGRRSRYGSGRAYAGGGGRSAGPAQAMRSTRR